MSCDIEELQIFYFKKETFSNSRQKFKNFEVIFQKTENLEKFYNVFN